MSQTDRNISKVTCESYPRILEEDLRRSSLNRKRLLKTIPYVMVCSNYARFASMIGTAPFDSHGWPENEISNFLKTEISVFRKTEISPKSVHRHLRSGWGEVQKSRTILKKIFRIVRLFCTFFFQELRINHLTTLLA